MGKLSRVAHTLRKTATKLSDADALLSLDPGRIVRRQVNKFLFKHVLGPLEDRVVLQAPKKKRRP
jgi:hypothetical protein